MRIVAGIDGGGTNTRVVLAGDDGKVLGRGNAGPSNIHHVGKENARQNILAALQQAWAQAGIPPRRCDAVFLGLAGISSARERDIVRELVAPLNLAPADELEIDHDIRIALAGGLAGREGIALIVGTGSSCYARRDDGRHCQVGGWGYLLDDVGGSVFLGLEALRVYARACDGREPETSLTQNLKSVLNLGDSRELVRRIYRPESSSDGLTPVEIAKLAPIVVQCAADGDGAAAAIVARGMAGLAEMVETAAKRMDFSGKFEVVLSGGLATSSQLYGPTLIAVISRRIAGVSAQVPICLPVIGAVLLALQKIGVAPSEEIGRKLAEN